MNKIMTAVLGIVTVVLGIIVAIVPHYVFPVCHYFGEVVTTKQGTTIPMKCFWTAQTEVALGALIVVIGLLFIISKQNEGRKLLGVIMAATGILVVSMPTYLIGMCMNPHHPCRVGTQPAMILLGVVIIIVAIVAIALARDKSTQ